MILERLNPSPRRMAQVRAITSVLPLTLSGLVWVASVMSTRTGHYDAWAFYPVLMIYGTLTLLDYLVGRDTANIETTSPAMKTWLRWLPLASVPLHLGMLLYAAHFVATAPLSWLGMIGWIFSVGVIGGVVAINVGHELVHKATRIEQWAGGIALASAAYGTFKIEHVLGHHTWVATERDPSSAPRGANVYTFVPRAMLHNVANAFTLEAAKLKRRGYSAWSWRNELWWWSGFTVGFAALLGALFGPKAVVFFAGQALVAIIHLELINFVEHYGLTRARDAKGRPIRVTHVHSWNSAYFLTNAFLFQLQRHSDHHASAGRRYQELRHHDDSPQLPGGYGAMLLLALVPPLWRRVIDPRIPQLPQSV
jgi:alkane 1-monooxygenase